MTAAKQNDIPNGNFELMIAAKKADLCKEENTKRIIEYVDLVLLENKMLLKPVPPKLGLPEQCAFAINQ